MEKEMYKKIASFLIISLIAFIITACADSAQPAETAAVITPEPILQTAAAMDVPSIVEPALDTEGAHPSFDENGDERVPANALSMRSTLAAPNMSPLR